LFTIEEVLPECGMNNPDKSQDYFMSLCLPDLSTIATTNTSIFETIETARFMKFPRNCGFSLIFSFTAQYLYRIHEAISHRISGIIRRLKEDTWPKPKLRFSPQAVSHPAFLPLLAG
jgi:hypothetical protein